MLLKRRVNVIGSNAVVSSFSPLIAIDLISFDIESYCLIVNPLERVLNCLIKLRLTKQAIGVKAIMISELKG